MADNLGHCDKEGVVYEQRVFVGKIGAHGRRQQLRPQAPLDDYAGLAPVLCIKRRQLCRVEGMGRAVGAKFADDLLRARCDLTTSA